MTSQRPTSGPTLGTEQDLPGWQDSTLEKNLNLAPASLGRYDKRSRSKPDQTFMNNKHLTKFVISIGKSSDHNVSEYQQLISNNQWLGTAKRTNQGHPHSHLFSHESKTHFLCSKNKLNAASLFFLKINSFINGLDLSTRVSLV
jgi:hypothetical protein